MGSSRVFQDWQANAHNPKARLVLVAFRLAQVLRGPKDKAPPPWALPYLVLYRVLVEWVLGIELPWNTQVGPGLVLLHGTGLVVNDGAVLGRDCILRQGVTIGAKGAPGVVTPAPVLGDGVDVGAHAQIIGGITIASGTEIGAGAIVVKDVPEAAVVVGNPARVVRVKD